MSPSTTSALPILPAARRHLHSFNLAMFSSAVADVAPVGVARASYTMIANVFLFVTLSLFLMHLMSLLL